MRYLIALMIAALAALPVQATLFRGSLTLQSIRADYSFVTDGREGVSSDDTNVLSADVRLTDALGSVRLSSTAGDPFRFFGFIRDGKLIDISIFSLGGPGGGSEFTVARLLSELRGIATIGDGAGSREEIVSLDPNGIFATAVPEPAGWATMIAGMALVGGGMRGRRSRRCAIV